MHFTLCKGPLLSAFLIDALIFLYFFTLSADLLYLQFPLCRVKVNHIIAILLCMHSALTSSRWQVNRKLLISLISIATAMLCSLFNTVYLPRACVHLGIFLFTTLMYFLLPLNLVHIYGRSRIFSLYHLGFLATGIFAMCQFFGSFLGFSLPFVKQHLLHNIARGQAMAFEPSYFALYIAAYVMYWNAKQLIPSAKNRNILSQGDRKCFYLAKQATATRGGPDIKNQFRSRPQKSNRTLFFGDGLVSGIRSWLKICTINLFLLVSTSTGAFFSYFLFFILIFLLRNLDWTKEFRSIVRRRALMLATALSLAFLLLFSSFPALFIVSFWKFFGPEFLSHHSFKERWEGIVNAWTVFVEHPLCGVGVGGIGPYLYSKYFDQEMVGPATVEIMERFDPTNVFTELLAALGLCGFAAFALFAYRYGVAYCMAAKRATPEEKKELYALLLSLATILLMWQFNQNLFRSYIWVHAALCLGYANTIATPVSLEKSSFKQSLLLTTPSSSSL